MVILRLVKLPIEFSDGIMMLVQFSLSFQLSLEDDCCFSVFYLLNSLVLTLALLCNLFIVARQSVCILLVAASQCNSRSILYVPAMQCDRVTSQQHYSLGLHLPMTCLNDLKLGMLKKALQINYFLF
jgi:hypothetical protein